MQDQSEELHLSVMNSNCYHFLTLSVNCCIYQHPKVYWSMVCVSIL